MEKLSVALITKNNARCIRRCLDGLVWADEIVILDGFSTDETPNICREYTDRIFQKEFESFPVERDYVLAKTAYRWVLSVDADMEFPANFCDEVRCILKNPEYDAYRCRGLTIFLGSEIRHCSWFDRRYIRLFNKEQAHYDLSLSVLDVVSVPGGRIGTMQTYFIHHQDESFIEYFGKIKRYSDLTSLEYLKKGVRINSRNAWYYLALKPFLVFLYKYFYKRGFLDGVAGLIVSINSAISYYSSLAATWDRRRTGTAKDDTPVKR